MYNSSKTETKVGLRSCGRNQELPLRSKARGLGLHYAPQRDQSTLHDRGPKDESICLNKLETNCYKDVSLELVKSNFFFNFEIGHTRTPSDPMATVMGLVSGYRGILLTYITEPLMEGTSSFVMNFSKNNNLEIGAKKLFLNF